MSEYIDIDIALNNLDSNKYGVKLNQEEVKDSIFRKFKIDAIDKTVFFTKSEAEAKLKEMSSSENPNK